MNIQEQFWQGEFGNAYTARNRVDWRARIPFWRKIYALTAFRSVYEIGANAGWNLSAIAEVSKAGLYGCEINEQAALQARLCGFDINSSMEHMGAGYDLVFTAGVLIHVAPENLGKVMIQIVHASTQWVLAIEYAADEEEEIEYRGYMERLWKRPYGRLYEAMGLKLVKTGNTKGFDRCAYWLMEKQ